MQGGITSKKTIVPGPGIFEFFRGATLFPAFHFHSLMLKYGDIVRCGPHFYLINDPDMAKALVNLSVAYRDTKKYDEALEFAKKADKLGYPPAKNLINSIKKRIEDGKGEQNEG